MKVIDSDNYAESGIATFFFPGGEPHANIPRDFGPALLFLKARTWNDMGIATAVLSALRSQGETVAVFAPYFPGARQDRTDGHTPRTFSTYYSMFAQNVNNLYTFDVHSDVVGRLVDKNYMPSDILSWASDPRSVFIIAPDAGAAKRAANFADHIRNYAGERFPGQFQVIQCEKKRNFSTGKFEGFTLPTLPTVGTYVVVDDICDGGGTFNLLAEEFVKDVVGQQSRLTLWVSHGIFSKGVSALHSKYESVMTTDSWCNLERNEERLDVISLHPIINKILEELE